MECSLTEVEMNTTVIKIEHDEKNNLAWLLLVVKVAIEMLVNGTALSPVAKNIESTFRLTCPTVDIEELPCIYYIRKARCIITIMSKSAAVHELAKPPKWAWTHWDVTSRRTTALTTFDATILDDEQETLRQVNLDCSKIVLGESSEETIEYTIEIINEGKEYLKRWAEKHVKCSP